MRGKSTTVILTLAVLFAKLASTQACFLCFNQPEMPEALKQVD